MQRTCAQPQPWHIVLVMNKEVVDVSVKGVMPTGNGCAVFLGNDDKNFVIYVDQSVGNAISMTLNGVKRDRPLTHDLMHNILLGLGVELDRIVINDVSESTFYARLILKMENELGKKILEVDARPSDSLVMALQSEKTIYVASHVFEAVDDMTEILERVLRQQNEEQE
jgi:bifunctional DNase/RNase